MRKRRKHLYRREDCKQNPVPPPKPLRSSRKDDRIWVMTKCKSATESVEAASKKGWTQERLAAEAEISVQQLRALEKGQRNLGVDHLGRLSDAMGVSSDFLLKGCSENSILVCKMLDDLKKKLQPPKQIAEKWAVLPQKQYILALYSNESTCYNIAMAQVSVAQEGKLSEMH